MIAEHYLGKLGDRVERTAHAGSLQEMRAQLETESVDIVFLDLTLPDSPMEQTLAKIDALTTRYGSKFVVMSSLGGDDIASMAIRRGALAFLPKQEINENALRAILDEVQPTLAAEASQRAEITSAAEKEGQEEWPSDAHEDQEHPTVDAGALASQIAHDALAWIANISFRASHIEADPQVQKSEELLADVASLRTSVEALTSFVHGSRALVHGELAAASPSSAAPEPIELGPWLRAFTARWKKTQREKRMVFDIDVSSSVILDGAPTARPLAQALSALLQNISVHADRPDGPLSVILREEATADSRVTVVMTDDGGPWQVADGERLGRPLEKGDHNPPRAGLGLFNARRDIESLGGALSFFEREDSAYAYGMRLSLPRG
jgi:DNA-binding NarL/FixJ family response regulator